MKRNQSHNISFRLDDRYLKKLEDEAEKHGLSVHQRARQFLLDVLDDAERERVIGKVIETKEGIAELKEEMKALRTDMAEAVEWIVKKLQTR